MDAFIEADDGHGSSCRVHLLDMSTTGCRLRSLSPPQLGDILSLDLLPGYHHNARVVWTDGHIAGCAFLHPLQPAVLTEVRRALEVEAVPMGRWVSNCRAAPAPAPLGHRELSRGVA